MKKKAKRAEKCKGRHTSNKSKKSKIKKIIAWLKSGKGKKKASKKKRR